MFEAAQAATAIYATTGELVAATVKATQPSVFSATLIDQLSEVTPNLISQHVRYETLREAK
jgi:hydroxyethylthiazole kinase-like sugar kinase family protein